MLTRIGRLWFVILLLAGCSGGASAIIAPSNTLSPSVSPPSNLISVIPVAQGFGAQKGFWRVFFNAPSGSADHQTYVGGIDTQLASDLASVQHTLDIAAFEFNNPVLTQAVLAVKARGVVVRIVTDDENGIQDTADPSLAQFKAAGIPIVDDGRSALMHDKFMLLDSTILWTGSWNYTINDTYRNNNNAIALRSPQVVKLYQAEFDEMFLKHQFGVKSPKGSASFVQDGTPIAIYFASEDEVVPAVIAQLKAAKTAIRFMAFSFTLDDMAQVLLAQAQANISVQGIFEKVGSETSSSELKPLFCAGLPMRQDGNPYRLHHKVFIIDDQTVIAGSFNFSSSARDSNDENLFIITDPDLAVQYIAEFDRRWAEAVKPSGLACT